MATVEGLGPSSPPGQVAALPASHYREIAPPPDLMPWLTCGWEQTISEGVGSYPQRVVPDGCVDVICLGNNTLLAIGPSTSAFTTQIPAGSAAVGVRFRPGHAFAALALPANEMLDAEIPLADLWGSDAVVLRERLAQAETPDAKARLLLGAVRAHLDPEQPSDPLVTAAVTNLRQRPESRVRDMAADLGVSERQLLRRFDVAVGYGPKMLGRVLRFQRFLRLAWHQTSATRDLASLAYTSGYTDQSHLTHECLRLAGVTPGNLLTAPTST